MNARIRLVALRQAHARLGSAVVLLCLAFASVVGNAAEPPGTPRTAGGAVTAEPPTRNGPEREGKPRPAPKSLDVPGLVCFWDFQEEAGQPRRSRGPHAYALEERLGPIRRVAGGIWGPYSAHIDGGQWFCCPREACPALNIHGPDAQFTILAWIQRTTDRRWQYIAGMWNETEAERQYALFVNGHRKTDWRTFTRTPADCQPHAYMSAGGGATPGNPFCFSYATGATRLEKNRWYFLAATYDQRELRVYVDGRLDALQHYNPFRYPGKPIFDGGRDGADFTVAQRAVPSWPDYPKGKHDRPVGFAGRLGGLAVYRRALGAKEIQKIHLAWAGSADDRPAPGEARVTWNPLSRPVRRADTLFLPDLASPETIQASGGWLHGHHDEGLEKVRPLFEFGEGPFGPAVRVKAEDVGHYWVFFPLDGLVPGDEFTLQFHAKSDRPWIAENGATFFRLNSRENELAFRIHEGALVVDARSAETKRSWRAPLDDAGLEAGRWHAFAVTLKDGTLRIYLDGRERGTIEKVRFEPLWSDSASGTEGIELGGAPWHSSNVWLSAVRLSRTARTPGKAVALRSLRTTLTVDASRAAGRIPPPFVGALHPGQKSWPPAEHPSATPAQIRAAPHVIRTDKFLQATPMKRGEPDAAHPAPGRSGRFAYDWQVVDRTLDWFRSHGVRPYISIDATPSLLGGTVEPFEGEKLRTALSRSAGFHPERPKDLDAWAAVVEDFVHHVLREYKMEVPWWGVWNEPDQPGFWDGTVEDYLDLYEATVRAVKTVDPEATVGGPESGLGGPWIEALVRRCAERDLPLDFISYHDYSGDLNTPAVARAKVDRLTKAAGLRTPMPIVLGEFNWSAGNLRKKGMPRFHRDVWHIRAFGAAYTTAFLTRMVDLPAMELLVWSHTRYGDPRAGGWAATQLIGPGGEQWAPYNALKGWKRVTGDRVLSTEGDRAPGVFALATRHGNDGAVGLVLVNYGFAQRQSRAVRVRLANLAAGEWRLTRWRVDPAHSSRWDAEDDPFTAADHDDLALVEERACRAERGRPLVLEVDLPPWCSDFLALRRP